ncbi:ribonuclease R [Mycoplasmopsis columbinasalis]|uniref:Ribonuclease R n=1 Tax=Mycoplasmopsis columbinasalis TaxID=114880 RepID=A0A449B9X7_9BACT|nr:ribonuclease R [Mycoplasmopsis columbinasalis]VEU77991.1 exoribonuclease II [Mycoplasmopsis columbinasalis]
MLDTRTVLTVIKKNPGISYLELAQKKLRIPSRKNWELTQILNELKSKSLITENKRDSFCSISFQKTIQGTFRLAQEGKFGFIEVENETETESYFVPKVEFNGGINGDVVDGEIYLIEDGANLTFARIKKVVERKKKTLTGVVIWPKMGPPIFNPINKLYNTFKLKIQGSDVPIKNNDVVLAEFVNQPKDKNKGLYLIQVKKAITNTNDKMCYVKAYITEQNVPEYFPAEVLNEAQNIPDSIENEPTQNRIDFRNELIVTIDGNDTKDFDDAINVKKLPNGNYELGVHIADVSYYVREKSQIDLEALKRGTSIYLMDRVIPMLPEKLSNGICSLNPNVDRFTLSAVMVIDPQGNTLETKLSQSIINSKYRLTYDRVNEYINDGKKFEDEKLNAMLDDAIELSKIVRKFKEDEGYVNFDIKEPNLILNEDGTVKDIRVSESGFSEKLIEDFMVRANEAVAFELTKLKFPALYRVHEKPSEEKLDYFLNVLDELNIKVDFDRNNVTPKTFQKVVNDIKMIRDDQFLELLFLRTMSKALYDPNNIGHFGLASKFYCHFTSPIRRYPDLIIHRILRDLVFGENHYNKDLIAESLPKIAAQNSSSEQQAIQIERDTNDLKYAEYWQNKIGQTFRAQIVSIVAFGMFVEFENKTEALVHISNMCDEKYEANELKTELIAEDNKKFKLGDFVDVIITNADIISGKVDAMLANCENKTIA